MSPYTELLEIFRKTVRILALFWLTTFASLLYMPISRDPDIFPLEDLSIIAALAVFGLWSFLSLDKALKRKILENRHP